MIGLDEYLDFLDFDYDFNFMTPEEEADLKYMACTHEWVEMGFMHSNVVCKHCDIEKKKWEKIISNPLKKD